MDQPLLPYLPKTEPWDHQARAFSRFRGSAAFALFMEQRTGKTKVIIDLAADAYERGLIRGLMIVAMPGRVHRNWVAKELPAHLPDRVPRLGIVWDAKKVRSVQNPLNRRWGFAGPLADPLSSLLTFEGLGVLAVNGEAVITSAFRRFAPRFLKARGRVMVVGDEFTLIMKTSGTKRTNVMTSIARRPESVIRAILDGTPVGEGPLDLFAPMNFLDPDILGFTSFYSFKHHYAEWEKKTDWNRGHDYEQIARDEQTGEKKYQNLDELRRRIEPVSFRVLRKDCWDAPDKVYQLHPFQLSAPQRKVYDDLAAEFEAEIAGGMVTARHALTRLLRLQQVCSNYWPPERVAMICGACAGDGCEACDHLGVVPGKTPLRRIDPKVNPRLEACLSYYETVGDRPGIVWCRFQEDVDQVVQGLVSIGRRPVRYDGRCTNEEKDKAEDAFQTGRATDLVGNPASGGRGLRLDRADFILNYSNYYSLLIRLQGEDRAESKEKRTSTGIIDLVAEDTVDDTSIVPALRAKKSVVDYVMNERRGAWL